MKRIWERIVPLSKADRSWDIQFWQAQSPSLRFNTTWKMLKDYYKIRGKKLNASNLRLQRAVESLKQASGRHMDIADMENLRHSLRLRKRKKK